MVIGKYVVRRAKSIKNALINRDRGSEEDIIRVIQIYNCRFLGICFYRVDSEFYKDKNKFLNGS
jgi:hypothetical protein